MAISLENFIETKLQELERLKIDGMSINTVSSWIKEWEAKKMGEHNNCTRTV